MEVRAVIYRLIRNFQCLTEHVMNYLRHCHRSEIIDQHNFDVDVYRTGHNVGSYTDASIVYQNVDMIEYFENLLYFVGNRIEIRQV